MSITHASGAARQINCAIVCATFIFSLLGLALLGAVAMAASKPVQWGSLIYGASLMLCAFCSFIYTTRPTIDGWRLWRHLDHSAIFLLIAGTYTPFAITIMGPFGMPLIHLVWILALVGVVTRLLVRSGYQRLFIGLYLLMGWVFLTALDTILATIDVVSLRLLGLGALAYTAGALVFARDIGRWTDPVWHLAVFFGAYLHYLAVLNLVTIVV